MNLEEIKKIYVPLNKKENNNPLEEGYKINKWTILYRTNNSKNNHIQYVCQCDCGTIAVVSKTSLVNEKSKKCKHCGGINLTNQRFGKLRVLFKTDSKNNRGYWHCKCDCGNECDVNTNLLTSGSTRSCGCLHDNSWLIKDITNQKFGKLTALYNTYAKDNNAGCYIWHCKCDCGNECDISLAHLRENGVQSCGCLKNTSMDVENIKQMLIKLKIPFELEANIISNDKKKRFDFYINKQYIIEYDGKQHFFLRNHSGWNSLENIKETRKRDLIKNKFCFNNNIPLIRIPYNAFYTEKDLFLETTNFLLTPGKEDDYYSSQDELFLSNS